MDRPTISQDKQGQARSAKRTYRGVSLWRPTARSQFSTAQIEKAVKDALAKNAEAVRNIR